MSRPADLGRRGPRSGPWLCFLLLAAPAAAQDVPRIRDVYASSRAAAGLGPTTDVHEILERSDAPLRAATAIQYGVHVATAGAQAGNEVELWGSVLLGDGSATPPRYRITLNGGGNGGSAGRTVVLASTGSSFVQIDMSARTFTEGADARAFGELAWLVPYLLVREVGRGARGAPEVLEFLGAEDVGQHPCYSVHFADAVRGEHVYVHGSSVDGVLRRVERVGMAAGSPRSVTVDVIDPVLEPPLAPEPFRTDSPPGFRRITAGRAGDSRLSGTGQ